MRRSSLGPGAWTGATPASNLRSKVSSPHAQPSSPPMTRPLGHWLLLFALVAMWGSAFMFTGIAVRGFSPTALVAIRLGIAAVLLTGMVVARSLVATDPSVLAVQHRDHA